MPVPRFHQTLIGLRNGAQNEDIQAGAGLCLSDLQCYMGQVI